MNEPYGYPLDGFAWRSEVAARVRDILGRKSVRVRETVAERLIRAARRVGGVVSQVPLRAVVEECLSSLRRDAGGSRRGGATLSDPLREEIRAYRSRESIENYGAYLFDVPSGFDGDAKL